MEESSNHLVTLDLMYECICACHLSGFGRISTMGGTPHKPRRVHFIPRKCCCCPTRPDQTHSTCGGSHLPTTVAERNYLAYHQMRRFFTEKRQARHYKQIVTLWVHWEDAYVPLYHRGWHATILGIEELVDGAHNIEYAFTKILLEPLALNHDQTESSDKSTADVFHGSDNSGEEQGRRA